MVKHLFIQILGDENKALEYKLKAYKMRKKLYDSDHPDLAQSLNSLAVIYKRLGDENKALEYELKAYEMKKKLCDSDHPDLAQSLNGLAVSFSNFG